MKEIEEILSEIAKIEDNNINAREKLRTLWKKIFLIEKNMTDTEKASLILMINGNYLKKRVYISPLDENSFNNGCEKTNFFTSKENIESYINYIVTETNEYLLKRGIISYKNLDTYYNCCKFCSLHVYELLKKDNIDCCIVHTSDFNLSEVPHFFVYAKFLTYDKTEINYIIDISFRQFLTIPFFIPERIYHFQNSFMSPAYYGDFDFFLQLGNKGYFFASDDNLKIYLDGFSKSAKVPIMDNYSNFMEIIYSDFNIERYNCALK